MRCQRHAIAIAALAALTSPVAFAQEAVSPTYSLSGFGTVAVTHTDSDLGEYAVVGQPHGAKDKPDFGMGSKVGVQGTMVVNPTFSATAQLLSRRNHESKWTPEFEWAFVKARINDTFSVRVGRMATPYFMVSDFRNVGYANTWIRPPLEVYNQVTSTRFEGADVLVHHAFGEVDVNAQVYVGSNTVRLQSGIKAKVKDMVGFSATAEYGPVTFRAGHSVAKLTVESQRLTPLVAGLRGVGATELASEFAITDKDAAFSGLGMSLDWNNVIANAEYTQRTTSTYLADTTGWSALAGYRLGTWTPYVQKSRLTQRSRTTVGNATVSPALNGAVNSLFADIGQSSTAVGVRWDAFKNVAIKAQYDRVKTSANGNGQFINTKPGFGADPVNVFALAVDFVW